MKVLVTGGAGYIGSITSHWLVQNGFEVSIVDDLSLGHQSAVPKQAVFCRQNVLEKKAVTTVFQKQKPDAVIHLAARSIVPESVQQPLLYYENNLLGLVNVLHAMRASNCAKIVFSSSAAVYGVPSQVPISEDAPTNPINPYGHCKLWMEQMLSDACTAFGIASVSLRYFNAAGAAFEVNENHVPETHLIPLVLNVANGKTNSISVFGTDYPTPDGTCIRDFVHVLDIAKAHGLALNFVTKNQKASCFNLGSGTGNSVLEVISTVEKTSGKKVAVSYESRRAGDPPILVASNQKASQELGWKPALNLDKIVESALGI